MKHDVMQRHDVVRPQQQRQQRKANGVDVRVEDEKQMEVVEDRNFQSLKSLELRNEEDQIHSWKDIQSSGVMKVAVVVEVNSWQEEKVDDM